MMISKNKLLTILPDAEQYALYGLPDFDDGQQLEYLSGYYCPSRNDNRKFPRLDGRKFPHPGLVVSPT